MNKKYIRKSDLISAALDDNLVMLDIQLGKYFSLNPVAARIWELLANEQSQEDLCQLLLEEFEVDSDTCKREVDALIHELLDLQLISCI